MVLLFQNIQPSTHLSMLQLDTGTGNSSRATQAVVTGFLHRLNTMFLRYPHRTHRPRPFGSLILIRTPRKGTTCQGNTHTSSGSSSPACSSTRNTQCLCTSRRKIPAVTPRPLGLGALGCRIPGSPAGDGGGQWWLDIPSVAGWTSGLYCVTCLICSLILGSPGPCLAPKPHVGVSFQPLVHLRS